MNVCGDEGTQCLGTLSEWNVIIVSWKSVLLTLLIAGMRLHTVLETLNFHSFKVKRSHVEDFTLNSQHSQGYCHISLETIGIWENVIGRWEEYILEKVEEGRRRRVRKGGEKGEAGKRETDRIGKSLLLKRFFFPLRVSKIASGPPWLIL